jgi:hypothetical protein
VEERGPEAGRAVDRAGVVEGPESPRKIEGARVGPVEAVELGRVLDGGQGAGLAVAGLRNVDSTKLGEIQR